MTGQAGEGVSNLVSLLKDSTAIIVWIEKMKRSKATSSLSLMTTTTFSTFPCVKKKVVFMSSGRTKSGRANKRKLITDCFYRASDILIQAWVA